MVMKTSNLWLLVLTFGLIMAPAGNLQAAPQYRYYTTGQGPGAEAREINDKNQAIVNFNDRAYLWTLSGGLQDLGDLGGGKSTAYGINNLGQIVGESYINSTTSHAFLWQSGHMQDLGVLPSGVGSGGWSINNLGQVIGGTLYSDNSISMFQWTQADGLQPLDLQGGLA
jgi:probable HAF family extracellular repeat protein